MNKVRIADIIKELRGKKGISQEMLADVCGVSMQAVSKWENGQCYPDITFLPVLAEYFQVSLDYLLTGEKRGIDVENMAKGIEGQVVETLKSETEQDALYIVQYRNGKVIDKNCFKSLPINEREPILLRFEDEFRNIENGLSVRIWGNAQIAGDIYGSVDAGGSVECGGINGCANAGGSISSAEINGSADAGGSINCAEVNGSVSAGGTVNCENVSGDVSAGAGVSCGNVGGDVTAGLDVSCSSVNGEISEGK